MDHLIGQRFNLISKSEIRYVGTLHEINPEHSTIALEDVFSFGTEDRNPDNFIPPSQQKFDYIVFRGSDVKDIKIVEDQKENKQPSPANVPNDPAILNASRPGPSQGQSQDSRGQSPFPPPGYPQQPQFGNYPPLPHQYGRGYGPPGGYGPGPQFYPGPPPPPGYFGPPGQGFQQGPGPFHQPPAPIGPPGQRQQPRPGQQMQAETKQTPELPDNKASQGQEPTPASTVQALAAPAPAPPQAPTPGAETSKSSAAPQVPPPPVLSEAQNTRPVPATGGAKNQRIAPAVPFAVNQKSFLPPASTDGLLPTGTANKLPSPKPAPTQADMEEASRQAKEAVAAAMAKLNPQTAQHPQPGPTAAAIDALTKKVSEMSTNGTASIQPQIQQQQHQRGRGGHRGGRAHRNTSGGPRGKIEIPKSDYDFESANAKFNKEDLIKEAIATGSPVGDTYDGVANGTSTDVTEPTRKDSLPIPTVQAYNKSTSFFDNISSEAREREEGGDARANARNMRSQEYRRNMETFGQGNVDSGYRGRGRGYRGRGRGYGGQTRGYGRGFGGRGRGGTEAAAGQQL